MSDPITRLPEHARLAPPADMTQGKTASGVAYVAAGSGAPHLLFHGGAGSWRHWYLNIRALSEHFRVIAIDSPSYGASDPVLPDIAAEAYVDRVHSAVDEIVPAPERVHISGFSFGGMIGAAVAARLGPRLASLALVGTAGFPRKEIRDLGLVGRRKLAEALGREPSEAEVRAMHSDNLAKLMIWDPAKIDVTAIDIQAANVARTRFDSRRLSWMGRMPEFLAAIQAPVKVIYGEHDTTTYPALEHRLEQVRAAKPEAEIEVVPGVGHWTQYEAPDAVNRALIQFHSRAESTRP
ncbi:MAG: alpha/beta fold hydrolase [Hyphomicrobiaceae bacterium]